MKKILNDPGAYVDETLDGLCLAYPAYYTVLSLVLHRRRAAAAGRP